jgi:hypothetical protein
LITIYAKGKKMKKKKDDSKNVYENIMASKGPDSKGKSSSYRKKEEVLKKERKKSSK